MCPQYTLWQHSHRHTTTPQSSRGTPRVSWSSLRLFDYLQRTMHTCSSQSRRTFYHRHTAP